ILPSIRATSMQLPCPNTWSDNLANISAISGDSLENQRLERAAHAALVKLRPNGLRLKSILHCCMG
ncbi:MAG: hypothetical protein NTZ17_16060, partial [Phycisphaerae bacterium]|nr:hypothetical protein [Phycisphaerae bacterium]